MVCRDPCLKFVLVEAVAHETPGGFAVADVGDDDQNSAGKISGPKTPNAVPQCSTSRVPELLARPRGARHPGNVYEYDHLHSQAQR